MKDTDLLIYTFYRFIEIKQKKKIKIELDKYFKNKLIRGTILLASEGINASISGTREDLSITIRKIKKILGIKKLDIKINKNKFLPFNRIKVRLKKEIVSLGIGEIDVNKFKGKLIKPSNWNKLINEKDIKLIDTRNTYEIDIGQFKGAIDPETTNFRQFPDKLKKIGIKKDDKIAMYCTGGIRCEKASAYLTLKGFKDVNQLEGGILNYLSYVKSKKKENFWKGECFVFDSRVTVNSNLKKGKYIQCYGCRHPITKEDTKLASYKRGISCKYCYKKRNKTQKNRSITRQNQINLAESKGLDHVFKKIKIK